MDNTHWLIGSASVEGLSHIESKTPCQDYSVVETSNNGKWVAIAVCDGAGSAKHSEIGSRLVAKTFAQKLILLSQELDTRNPGNWINDFVIQQVLNVRESLRLEAQQDQLNDYHTTLVACLIGETGGFVVHIGDGAIIGGSIKNDQESIYVENSRVISEPQNGEYSNETYFITESNWIKNLRITPISSLDWMILGTDGGSAFYLLPNNNLIKEFIASFLNEILEVSPFNWSERIKEILINEQANKITNDDKTIVVLVKKDLAEINNKLKFLEKTIKADNELITLQDQLQHPTSEPELQLPVFVKKKGQRKFFMVMIGIFTITLVLALIIFIMNFRFNINLINEITKIKNP